MSRVVMSKPPAHGVRFELRRQPEMPGLPTLYRGTVFIGGLAAEQAAVAVVVRVDRTSGAVVAELEASASHNGTRGRGLDDEALARTAEALVRAATKSRLKEGRALPNRITRWRGASAAVV